jgi:uracil-DNA glycosylase
MRSLVAELARARIGSTFNQYAASPLRQARLRAYLDARSSARWLLVGEAAGYRGARVSGLPFTSERQLSGAGPGEASATIVHRVLAELGAEPDVLLWNLVPTHPYRRGNPLSNRRPTRTEVESSRPFLHRLARGRRVVPVGRLALCELGGS